METFVYNLGAWTLSTGAAAALFALLNLIEGGRK